MRRPRSVLGLDIGGANLKAAHTDGTAALRPYELWKDPARLPRALSTLVHDLPAHELLAVTMTGELCDCFETRRQGVQVLLDAVTSVAGLNGFQVWRNDGSFVDPAAARATPLEVAAANWLALASLAGRLAPSGPGLLVDIGSTTTDIVPLQNGQPIPTGRSDPERLRCQELVYTGVRRTPLMALLGPRAAAELFATTQDAYLLLGNQPEDPTDCATADGRPATRAAARARLARMLCADCETCSEDDLVHLAEEVRECQLTVLDGALRRVAGTLSEPPKAIVLAGSGEFLARAALARQATWKQTRVISLAGEFGSAISRCACAYAVAVLAGECGDAAG